MTFLIIIGASAGMAAGALQLFLSYVAPAFGAGNFIAEAPEPIVLGKKLSRRETQLVAVLLHLVTTAIFGALYALAVNYGWITDFSLIGIAAWSVILSLLAGLIFMPLEGHGLFGRRHDAWFFADSLISHLFWGLAYFGILQLWIVQ